MDISKKDHIKHQEVRKMIRDLSRAEDDLHTRSSGYLAWIWKFYMGNWNEDGEEGKGKIQRHKGTEEYSFGQKQTGKVATQPILWGPEER